MENKEIIIYELMGLIKDGKAPYEIIYKNSKYFIDELEGYYKKEDGTPLFEHIFDNYNDYDALQEKIEILPEENDEWEDIKEIVFLEDEESSDKINRNFELFANEFNKLIKNQRKIIEKLESKNENL